MIKNGILEEADVTPEPVGGQSVDKGVEEREDNVWVMIVTYWFLWLIIGYCWISTHGDMCVVIGYCWLVTF